MKNNKLLYLLTIFITLFTFNINVNAAQELTCLYSNEEKKINHLALVQYYSGERALYELQQSENLDFNSDKWRLLNNMKILYSYVDKNTGFRKDVENISNLNDCPKGIHIANGLKYLFDIDTEVNLFYTTDKYVPFKKKYDSLLSVARVNTIVPSKVSDPGLENLIDLKTSKYTGKEYTGFCKYKRGLGDTTHYIQINISEKDILVSEFDPAKGDNGIYSGERSASFSAGDIDYIYSFNVSQKFNFMNFINDNSGNCPSEVFVARVHEPPKINADGSRTAGYISTTVSDKLTNIGNKAEQYILYSVNGTNPITKEILKLDEAYGEDIRFVTGKIESCEDLLGEDIFSYINIIWNMIKIGIPIILVGFGTVDFTQAIFSGKEDGMKKVQAKFIKRILIAVIIFIVPSLLSFILEIVNSIWGNIGKDICGIIF